VAQGFTLTADERAEIFATNSIETIVDPSGTYAKYTTPTAPAISTLVGQPVNGSAIEVKGTGEPSDTVTLYADGGTTPVGTGTIAVSGSFDIITKSGRLTRSRRSSR
jgi:hypothetical protein